MLQPAGCCGYGRGAVGGSLSGERLPAQGLYRQDTPQSVYSDGYGKGGASADKVPDWKQNVPGCLCVPSQRFRGMGICSGEGE